MKATRTHYEKLFSVWSKAFPEKKGDARKKDTDLFWNENKGNISEIEAKILELKNIVASRQQKPIFTFFPAAVRRSSVATQSVSRDSQEPDVQEISSSTDENPDPPKKQKLFPTNAQDECKQTIAKLNSRIVGLHIVKSSGIATTSQLNQLQNDLKEVKRLETRLAQLEKSQLRQQKFRDHKKQALEDLQSENPEAYFSIQKSTKSYPGTRGRPALEVQQPLLHKAIIDLVSPTAGTHERRRAEMLRTCSSLDELHDGLLQHGFVLSRSALYLRLLPKRSDTRQGHKHVTTVPVKLTKATNDGRSNHEDSKFCSAAVKYLYNLAEMFGVKNVFVLSQDDKARVPLGITAAVKQAPILMHMDYQIRLSDHDFPKGTQHKLIPSVYAGLAFKENGTVGYSGPTYVAIRSGKHDKSSAASHGIDFRRLFNLPNFNIHMKNEEREVKPIGIIISDGGPDENPRFEGTLNQMVSHFREFNLDALFLACHAPTQSAYNPVERRMAPLSRDLSGVVLPHDSYGSHLEGTKTVDCALEKRNFNRAGECLAEIWNEKVIDNFDVHAEYIPPPESGAPPSVSRTSEQWIMDHVRQSQYFLQIMKCDDPSCCTKARTNIKEILKGGFVPGPAPFLKSSAGVVPSNQDNWKDGSFGDLFSRLALQHLEPETEFNPKRKFPLPFDYFCPSLKDKIRDRVCPVCHLYFPTTKAKTSHQKIIHKSSVQDIVDTIEFVVQNYKPSDDIEVIHDIQEWLASPFTEILV